VRLVRTLDSMRRNRKAMKKKKKKKRLICSSFQHERNDIVTVGSPHRPQFDKHTGKRVTVIISRTGRVAICSSSGKCVHSLSILQHTDLPAKTLRNNTQIKKVCFSHVILKAQRTRVRISSTNSSKFLVSHCLGCSKGPLQFRETM